MLQARPPMTLSQPPLSAPPALTYPVALLMAQIGDACDGPADAMDERIIEALRAAAASPGLLSAELRAPKIGCYARHIVASDPAGRFTLLSLIWGEGQFSPPHAHQTWCAYAVVESPLTETLFDFDAAAGKAIPRVTAQRDPGYACFAPAGLEQIHRLGNGGAANAISIHVYGVEGARVGTHVNQLIDTIG